MQNYLNFGKKIFYVLVNNFKNSIYHEEEYFSLEITKTKGFSKEIE